MHTNYGRGVKLISDERRVCTVVLVQVYTQQRLQTCGICNAWGIAQDRQGTCLHVTFDLLLRMLFH